MPFFRRLSLAVSLGASMIFGAADDAAAQSAVQRAEAQAVRAARAAQNEAIAAGDLDAVTSFWTEDITVRRALGSPVAGRAAARAAFEPPTGASPTGAATTTPRIVYRRIPNEVEVSTQWPLAYESGVWEGREGTRDGPVIIGGKFSAQWVKRDGRWLIRSEVFVALTCAGAGCSLVAVP
jgi:ketosteroid isomerase-like protein